MPVYQYKGQHYELADGYTPEQALDKIKTHLGESSGESFFDKAVGAGEAALSTASGIAAAVPRGLRTLGEMAFGGADLPTAIERSQSSGDAATYEPRTEAGKRMNASVGKTLQDYSEEVANKFSGDTAYLAGEKLRTGKPLTASDLAAENTERAVGEVIGNTYAPGIGKFGARAEARPVKPKVADVEGAINDVVKPKGGSINTPPDLPPVMQMTPEGQGIAGPNDAMFKAEAERKAALVQGAAPVDGRALSDPFGSMKQQLGVPQNLPADPNSAMAQLANRLQGEQPSPLVKQGELFPNERPDLKLEGGDMDLPPLPPIPELGGEVPDMFGNRDLFELDGGEGQKAPVRPETGEGMTQGELDVTQPQMELKSEGEMAPPVEPKMMDGTQEQMLGHPDLFDLKPDTNASMTNLLAKEQEQAKAAAVNADPRVQKASANVEKATQVMQDAVENLKQGRVNVDHVARLQKDLQAQMEAHDFLRKQVAEEQAAAAKRTPAAPLSQRGSVDITPLRIALEKAIGVLRQSDLPVVKAAVEKYEATNSPKVFSDARRSAQADGINGDVLKSLDDAYMAATQHTLGSMENLLDQQKNRLRPGPKPGSVPRKGPPGKRNQSGAIMLESNKQKALENLSDKIGIETKLRTMAPSQWTVEQAIDAVKKAGDVVQNYAQKASNYVTKGGLYLADRTQHPLVRYTVERMLGADRRAKADVADWIHSKDEGLGALMRGLDKQEATDAWTMINAADLAQRTIDLARLAERGFSAKVIQFIEKHRQAMDYGLQMINKARLAAGKDPIDARVAYAAMRATGDFRRIVYDQKGGRVIGIVSSNFRGQLNKLKSDMEGRGYYVDKEKYFGGRGADRGSANDAFMRAIETLAENDPRVQEFVDVLNDLRKSEINNYLNMKRHTMQKKGVFGMEGRKDWESAHQNALDGFKTQLNYLEGAIKWGHLSEAFNDVKQVLNSPDTQHAVNARDLSERYVYNALGYNPSEIGRNLERTISSIFDQMGVGFSVGRQAISGLRYFTNSMLLTLRPSFWYQNLVQPLQAMPGMKADLIARGLDAGFDFGTGYSYVFDGTRTAMRIRTGSGLTAFDRAAAQYARRNHVYGTDMVEHSNRVSKGAGYYVDQVNDFMAGNIESVTRQVMFHAFSHMLKENGMSLENGLFDAAHNLTDMAMNNYSALERPQLYNMGGPAGSLAVNLQSYKHNELSRVAMFIRDGMQEKSMRPLVADTLTRFAFGGIMGLLAYDEVDALFHWATKAMGHPMSLTDLVYRMSEGVGKAVDDASGGKIAQPYVVSNGLHAALGLDMSRSLGLTDVVPNSVPEAMFTGGHKIAQIVGSTVNALPTPWTGGPTEMNLKRAAYDDAPAFAQGALSNQWFTKGTGDDRVSLRPRDLKAQAYRSDADAMKKNFGFTGINESVQRQKTFNIETVNRDYADLRQKPLDHMRDALYASGTIKPKDVEDYVNYRGTVETLTGDLQRYAQEQRLTPSELAIMRAEATSSVGALLKARDYAKAFSK